MMKRMRRTRPSTPFTTRFLDTPSSHDGTTGFSLELRFSETPKSGFSYKTLRDHAFTVTGGHIVRTQRPERPGNIRWEMFALPDPDGTLSVVPPATTDCGAQGAVCTGDGRMLAGPKILTLAGPG